MAYRSTGMKNVKRAVSGISLDFQAKNAQIIWDIRNPRKVIGANDAATDIDMAIALI